MMPYYEDGLVTLYQGDMRDVVPQIQGITAIVTDPPYGLSFMSRDWDHGVPGEPFWHLLRDICLPGAPLLAFGSTRTFHRLVCAIEDAGWEVRDTLSWVYSSGFPKNHDISKALDKVAGAEREVVGEYGNRDGVVYGMSRTRVQQGARPTITRSDGKITVPRSPLAQLWNGYGSALSPAWEPITLARKPLEGTLAQNVTQHGVGGLNIDGGRIPTNGEKIAVGSAWSISSGWAGPWVHREGDVKARLARKQAEKEKAERLGRWPKNFLHDGSAEVEALFPHTTSGLRKSEHADNGKGKGRYGDFSGGPRTQDYGGDAGSASRFFYTAKASASEREAYNDHPTVKPLALMTYLVRLIMQPQRNLILDPFCGSGSTLVAAKNLGLRCIGIDQDAHALDIAVERLRQEVLPFGGHGG